MPKASYEGAAMANVCRPLQNGLPALRFAVIRRALELCFWNWALNPHAWVSLSSTHDIAMETRVAGFLDFCQFSPSALTSIAFDAGERRRASTRQESRAGTVVVDRTAA